jgi:hypothetical protein
MDQPKEALTGQRLTYGYLADLRQSRSSVLPSLAFRLIGGDAQPRGEQDAQS